MRPALVDAWRWSAVEAVTKLRAREVSPAELLEVARQRIEVPSQPGREPSGQASRSSRLLG